ELTPEAGRLRLSTYGYSEPSVETATKPFAGEDVAITSGIIKQIIASSGMKATKAAAALPGASVFHAIITIPVPKSTKDDVRAVIEAQASKILPLPLAEMILDSHILDKDLLPKDEGSQRDKGEKGGQGSIPTPSDPTIPSQSPSAKPRHIRVQITGAPKSVVAKYVEIFKAAKLELVSLETEAFALLRALVGKDASRVMIVDIGAERSNVIIAEKGVPFLTRVVKGGGNVVTQALSGSMGVGVAEAETMKKDMTFQSDGTLPPVVEAAMKPLIHEMRYALQLYAEQDFHENRVVDKIILTGGSSSLPGLARYVTQALNVNCYLGDPWARVATQPEARPVLDEVGSRFAVAAGLAMRAKEDK
ncbi:MAG: pilus assembly protein PilM, partial [Candidatus Uhrbacteria bacterium]|nr:pilus assembly protein PilM [Candidatus Uhrbacteria bacterium]